MDKLPLPPDFKDFLRLLNSAEVEYLLVGGYAVGIYGYPRATGDMDIWIAANPSNAEKVAGVLRKFGFATATVRTEMFCEPDQMAAWAFRRSASTLSPALRELISMIATRGALCK